MNSASPPQNPVGRNEGSSLIGVAIFCLFAIAAGGYLFYWAANKVNRKALHPALGKTIGELELEPLLGNVTRINADDLSGRIVLINLWGPWCIPCRLEFPYLIHLERRFRSIPTVRFLSVSYQQEPPQIEEELRDSTQEFVQTTEAEFPIYWDPEGRAFLAVAKLTNDPPMYPTTVLLDRDGTVQGYWNTIGPDEAREIEVSVVQLLKRQH